LYSTPLFPILYLAARIYSSFQPVLSGSSSNLLGSI
jgi:hypothetical protein